MSKFKTNLFKFMLILIIGGLGGIFADRAFLPYLANISPFSKLEFIKRAGNNTTIINKTEEVYIIENTALEQAIDKVEPSLVVVQSYRNKEPISRGSGFIVTSDGLVLTAADLILDQADQYLVLQRDRFLIARLLKKDSINNLALLKVDEANLPVVALADLADLRLGENIILVGAQMANNNFYYFVNIGTIRSIESETLTVNLDEKNQRANGGSLINIRGEVIGLNLVDEQGLVRTMPANEIKKFISL